MASPKAKSASKGKGGKSAAARGKGGLGKRRVIKYTNSINGVTKGSLRRLARRGGVKRLSATVYDEVRRVLNSWVKNTINAANLHAELGKAKTLKLQHVLLGLKNSGRTVYGW